VSNKRIGLIVGVVLLIVALGVTIFLVVHKIKTQRETIEDLTSTNEELQSKIDAFGGYVNIYVASEDIRHGSVFDAEKVTSIEVPANGINESYVTDLTTVENMIYKLDVHANTPLVNDIFINEDITSTLRYYDVVLDSYPVGVKAGDYIDIRFVTAEGCDYVVLAKKRLVRNDGDTLRLPLDEEEIHRYQSCLIDHYLDGASYLYSNIYVEPSMQKEASVFYPVNTDILTLMKIDPNLSVVAYNELKNSRQAFESTFRKYDPDPASSLENRYSNIQSGMNKFAAAVQSAADNFEKEQEQLEDANSTSSGDGEGDGDSDDARGTYESNVEDSTSSGDSNQDAVGEIANSAEILNP
jgi:hypothetical protein